MPAAQQHTAGDPEPRPTEERPIPEFREPLERILARYEQARVHERFGREHELLATFRELGQSLRDLPALRQRAALEVAWSAGQGRWAKLPWIALLDARETRTTQRGVYGTLLFRQDMSGVYLALTQGTAEPIRQLGRAVARASLQRRAADLRALCDDLPGRGFRLDDLIDLRTDSPLGVDYRAATVAHKLYDAGEVPADELLLADLEALLRVYDRYLAHKRAYTLMPNPASVRERRRKPPERRFAPAAAVERLVEVILAQNYVFEPWQVAAYVAALRTKPFVILAGVTGTGKSRLPALVAGATGGVARLMPVRPDWTDSSDVLGYMDLQGGFRPGVLLEVAREAMSHPERHWVCVLDEMNLARVEQYFAEVLSRIEDRRPSERGGFASLPLLPSTAADAEAWAAVVLPPNLALVGTVNMDESAHGFSRKVLDRAFTLEFSEVDLMRWEAKDPSAAAAEPASWPVSAWMPRAIRLGELTHPSDAERGLIREAIGVLAAANDFLVQAQLQIGYRSRDEVALFVLHAGEIRSSFVSGSGEPVDPLDLALHMKLLPRIAGGSGAVQRTVLGLLGWAYAGAPRSTESDARRLLDAWERAGRPSALPDARFPRTAARLCLMWERLLTEGYTSFWL